MPESFPPMSARVALEVRRGRSIPMSHFTHEGTDALKRLAEEVEQERVTKGHTPFDEIADDESHDQADEASREPAEDDGTGAPMRVVPPQLPH